MNKHYYDPVKDVIVCIKEAATPEFWDEHWKINSHPTKEKINPFINKITARYLLPDSRILEGGCGNGLNVFSLNQAGFNAHGIDYATKTITMIKKNMPQLNIIEGDVRNLPFKKNCFDGYWSIGVIEHFYDGYTKIADEMMNIIKPGGYLFLIFPQMHLLRRIKAQLGLFPIVSQNYNCGKPDFYQYILNTSNTITYFESIGFELIHTKKIDGVKGLKDESSLFRPFLQPLYNNRSFFFRLILKLLDFFLVEWTGHCALLVMRKKS